MKHCMVVDDSEVIRKVARAFLERMGYIVTESENGEDAIKRCDVAMPDLILLDWHMPGMTAIETLTALRRMQEQANREPVIVYMTTENDDEDIARAKSAGANDCLLKPFDRVAFDGKITECSMFA